MPTQHPLDMGTSGRTGREIKRWNETPANPIRQTEARIAEGWRKGKAERVKERAAKSHKGRKRLRVSNLFSYLTQPPIEEQGISRTPRMASVRTGARKYRQARSLVGSCSVRIDSVKEPARYTRACPTLTDEILF